jgi:hypothetical protein
MIPTIHLVLVTALRDRLFQSLFALLAVVVGMAIFVGGSAVSEPTESVTVFAAGAARIAVVIGLVVFVAFHIERLIETREIEAILSRAIARGSFLFAYWLGLAVVATLVVMPIAIVVAAFSSDLFGSVLWAISIALESIIMIAFVIFCGLTFGRAVPTVFAALGFYALARSLGFLIGFATGQFTPRTGVNSVLNPYVEFLGLALPRLDLFGQSRWLIYGLQDADLFWIFPAQGVVYVALLLLAANYDLSRKQF